MGQGIGPATVVSRRSDALWRDTPGGVLVLGDGDDLICIEGAGRVLWLVLERPATMAELGRLFAGDDLAEGLERGVQDLVDLGLVGLS
ncbi:MAG: hypothetical protein ACXWCM_06680 [Acidimicrobiales bacterium]